MSYQGDDEDEGVEVSGRFVTDTEKAVLVEVVGEEHWIPKSQIKRSVRNDKSIDLTISTWIAGKIGLG